MDVAPRALIGTETLVRFLFVVECWRCWATRLSKAISEMGTCRSCVALTTRRNALRLRRTDRRLVRNDDEGQSRFRTGPHSLQPCREAEPSTYSAPGRAGLQKFGPGLLRPGCPDRRLHVLHFFRRR